MPLEFGEKAVRLIGNCGAEDALELVDWLAKTDDAAVDLSRCEHLHAALLQTLFAHPHAISAAPAEPFLARWILPVLARDRRRRAPKP